MAEATHPLDGFGAQLNTNLFTTAGEPRPLTQAQVSDLQAAIDRLQPGFSRILVRRGLRADTAAGRRAPEFVALLRTIELAQHAGAEVNLTFWGQGPYANERRLQALRWPNRSFRDWPDPARRKWPPELTDARGITQPRVLMNRFAGVLHEIRRRGLDCVTSVTIQNEVNGAGVDIAKQHDQYLSMRFYELLYRFLDTASSIRRPPTRPGSGLAPTRRTPNSVTQIGARSPSVRAVRSRFARRRSGFAGNPCAPPPGSQ